MLSFTATKLSQLRDQKKMTVSLKLGCVKFNPFMAEFRHNVTVIVNVEISQLLL